MTLASADIAGVSPMPSNLSGLAYRGLSDPRLAHATFSSDFLNFSPTTINASNTFEVCYIDSRPLEERPPYSTYGLYLVAWPATWAEEPLTPRALFTLTG
ncbi:hypothetical protein ABVK25_006569 [Lepraria finkii]|uniref:Uncharacterized protein n=1 Tax=Lepraria finkii TaxID=1340010 RepID=A0ABR4B5W9_9LECA